MTSQYARTKLLDQVEQEHLKQSRGGKQTVKTEVLYVGPPEAIGMLVIMTGTQQGKVTTLDTRAPLLVGRDAACDLILDESSVSSRHAKVIWDKEEGKDGQFFIHDLATQNGTKVNNQSITKHYLNDGDHITLGRAELIFKQI